LDAAPALRIVTAWTDTEPRNVDGRQLFPLGRRLPAADPTNERRRRVQLRQRADGVDVVAEVGKQSTESTDVRSGHFDPV
jgi:hypothetical protein